MSERRRLSFANEDEAIAEIDRLRAGGYRKLGNWTLAMMCRHLRVGSDRVLKAPASTTPTPEQAQRRKDVIDAVLATGKPPAGMQPPPDMIPSPDCQDGEIDRYKQTLERLKAYPHAYVDFGPFGPVETDVARKLFLMHTAHHLSHLQPVTPARRANLRYADEDAVIADVNALREGYTQSGSWSLERICWHLNQTTRARMRRGPFPPNTPEQDARAGMVEEILASGKLPPGIQTPDAFIPPIECDDDAVDAFVDTLREFQAYRGLIAPHRVFGHLDDASIRRLNLIHCAHHLSYLSPTPAAAVGVAAAAARS
jgi:hypothetical protein